MLTKMLVFSFGPNHFIKTNELFQVRYYITFISVNSNQMAIIVYCHIKISVFCLAQHFELNCIEQNLTIIFYT